MEIYNEKLVDLLAEPSAAEPTKGEVSSGRPAPRALEIRCGEVRPRVRVRVRIRGRGRGRGRGRW